jgi:hypothetical protein
MAAPRITFSVYRDRDTGREWATSDGWTRDSGQCRVFTAYRRAVGLADRNHAWVAALPHPWNAAPGERTI